MTHHQLKGYSQLRTRYLKALNDTNSELRAIGVDRGAFGEDHDSRSAASLGRTTVYQ
jgi:hypothetical protein